MKREIRDCLPSMIFVFVVTIFAQEPPSEIFNVVNEELKGNHIWDSDEGGITHLGFKKKTKLADVKAGVPIQILRINWKLLEAAGDSASISSIVDIPEAWYVPVLEDGKVINFLNVVKKENKWMFVGWGPSGLCCGWKKVLKHWPNPKYHATIIGAGFRVFFNIIEKGDYNLTEFIPFPCPDEIPYNSEYIKSNPIPDYKKLTSSSITIRDLKKH